MVLYTAIILNLRVGRMPGSNEMVFLFNSTNHPFLGDDVVIGPSVEFAKRTKNEVRNWELGFVILFPFRCFSCAESW